MYIHTYIHIYIHTYSCSKNIISGISGCNLGIHLWDRNRFIGPPGSGSLSLRDHVWQNPCSGYGYAIPFHNGGKKRIMPVAENRESTPLASLESMLPLESLRAHG